MSLRDSLARRFTGGHPFMVLPDELIVDVDYNGSFIEKRLDDDEDMPSIFEELKEEFEDLGFEPDILENTGAILLKAERLSDVIDNVESRRQEFSDEAITQLTKVREEAKSLTNRTIVGGYGFDELKFNAGAPSGEDEASIRNALMDIELENSLTNALEEIEGVLDVSMRHTVSTCGPRSLRVDPGQLASVLPEQFSESNRTKLPDVFDIMNVEEAWEYNTGEDAIVAVFDTGFCEEFFDEDRIIDTYHSDDVDSAFSDHEMEGHGTMTAVSAAGNKDEGAPFDGVAKDAELILVRITDSEHALSETEKALDWFAGVLDDVDKPVISNHSYGVPLCSARPMGLCEDTPTKIARELSERDDHQAVYAAGNEADYCGRRLSGITNGISGINSDPSSITVGAMRSDGSEIQRYSSHGNGTCSDSDNPKPDVAAPIPQMLPYACDTKDMTSGIGGSSGGTSTASPITAGIAALVASEAGTAEKSVIAGALKETAEQPRRTQINIFKGSDARFGAGMVNAKKAVEHVMED